MRQWSWIALLVWAAACRPAASTDGSDQLPPGPLEPPTELLLERLALLATQHIPEPGQIAQVAAAIDADPGQLAPYIDRLLRDRRFATEVAPAMLLPPTDERMTDYVLRSTRSGDGEAIYYLRRPCAPEVAERVQPWWAADTTVRVCPDSYRPDYVSRPGTDWQCGSAKLNRNAAQDCGCGPHLASCFRDNAHREAVRASLRNENRQTVAWVVDHDLPIETLFTSNATYRDYSAELIYTNWRVLDGEAAAYPRPADWPGDGKWAPRAERRPGMHAGILTTPHTLFSADATRPLMRHLYEVLWCKTAASVHVDPATIWSLGVTDLRFGSGWQQLAAMPVCTSCHARLDHGAQMFSGYLGTQRSFRYMPSLQRSGNEPVYGDDIDDPRGVAERSPLGFGRFATAQREFAACMVEDVARGIFGGPATKDDERALREAFGRSHSFREVVRAALLREAARWQAGASERTAPAWPVAQSVVDPAGSIALSPELRAELARACGDCHADGPRAFTEKPALARAWLTRMLREVAFGDMPRSPAVLPVDRRRTLVRALIAALYPDEPSRNAARRVFDDTTRWRAPVSESARLAAVHAHAGVPEAARPALDRSYYAVPRAAPQSSGTAMTATIAVDLGAAAIADCTRPGVADRDTCMDRALRLEAIVTDDAE